MEITKDHIELFKEVNTNLKKVMKLLANNKEEKFVSYKEAVAFLKRSRTWIQERMKESVTGIKEVDKYLFKDADYVKYGNQIQFRLSSLERLKQAIINQS